ncbi:nuclear transport factor 2 family protein [Chryseobacterium sp. PS-8]|uniref:Nuclear transport factor 2 family protein n=1 Tax=Chryseobacterium indicum TaxID=2766954 RepID=A0ABS9CAE3_9FLAO|nr:nuclear transport factor 2 family protein [Chryseobacterium sp. PS-8]MCF2220649.1 nuclear transport factor 2 family protein [Chryseobacterium sp. PS-8]
MKIPDMQRWVDIWNNSDFDLFIELYEVSAIMFSPEISFVKGNKNIAAFLKNQVDKIDISFITEEIFTDYGIVYEEGTYQYKKNDNQNIISEGKYLVIWVLDIVEKQEEAKWRIRCHIWN